jgi:RimJ/RimL family protein N-acetyltransferase
MFINRLRSKRKDGKLYIRVKPYLNMKEILQTQRLLLREFETADAQFIIELVNDPDWIKYIVDKHIYTEEAAIAYIESLRVNYEEFDFGFYCMVEKDSGKPIGLCGLIKRPYLELVDLGFATLKEYRNRGYTSEASKAMMHFAHKNLELEQLAAITNINNYASRKLLLKLGFKFKTAMNIAEDGKDIVNYFVATL